MAKTLLLRLGVSNSPLAEDYVRVRMEDERLTVEDNITAVKIAKEKLCHQVILERDIHAVLPQVLNRFYAGKVRWKYQLPKKRGKIGYCKGCRPQNKDCSFIKKKCKTKEIYEIGFCFECSIFPCETLECGSKKYKARYNYDFVESLYSIKEKGMRRFIENQVELHKCLRCGDTVCIHNQKCYSCDKDELIS